MIDKQKIALAPDTVFESEIGSSVLRDIIAYVDRFSMREYISSGVVVGFSGGADSVLLLIFLAKLRKEMSFDLKAIHVNHLIRGKEAEMDEAFSKSFCDALGVDFISVRCDVPAVARDRKCGIEEAARSVRYEEFKRLTDSDPVICSIATAHNATDNLETFIFNLMRGSGISGLCGIGPVKGNIIRPLLAISKPRILELLTYANIPFVTDSTNFSIEYSRNYIRNEILPKLGHLSSDPEGACSRAIENLRTDREYIDAMAESFFDSHCCGGTVDTNTLMSVPRAIMVRVLRLMAASVTDKLPEKVHIDSIISLLERGGRFEVDLPGEVRFTSNGSECFIAPRRELIKFMGELPIVRGFNEISDLGIAVNLSHEKEIISSNVYKFSIQADLSSAIIFGDIRVRTRRNGDSYFYGGIRRKVKKLMNDKKIPPEKRDSIPVFFDDKGILWIPGFGVRDDKPGEKHHCYITVYEKDSFSEQ